MALSGFELDEVRVPPCVTFSLGHSFHLPHLTNTCFPSGFIQDNLGLFYFTWKLGWVVCFSYPVQLEYPFSTIYALNKYAIKRYQISYILHQGCNTIIMLYYDYLNSLFFIYSRSLLLEVVALVTVYNNFIWLGNKNWLIPRTFE